MGSIIQSTPLLQSLRASFPAAKIIFISNLANKPLIDKIPFVDKSYFVSDRSIFSLFSSFISLIFRLITFRKSVFLDLEIYSNFSTIVTTLSCATNRIGFYRKDVNIRLGIYTHMLNMNINYPISQSYLQMARLMGCKVIVESLYNFEGPTLASERIKSLPGKYIVINPNASDLRLERRWPANNFVSLIKRILSTEKSYSFVFIGSIDEEGYVKALLNSFDEEEKQNIIDTSGKLTIDELFQLIKGAALMITNDTGPMHIAFANNIPTLALFGPCNPSQYGLNAKTYCFYKAVYCSPCVHEFAVPPCKGNNQCMQQIEIVDVLEVFKGWLSNPVLEQVTVKQTTVYLDNNNSPLGIVRRNAVI
jgi:ADP-heptose:LPS heptosyltransferase